LLQRLLGPQQAAEFDGAEEQHQKQWRGKRELDRGDTFLSDPVDIPDHSDPRRIPFRLRCRSSKCRCGQSRTSGTAKCTARVADQPFEQGMAGEEAVRPRQSVANPFTIGASPGLEGETTAHRTYGSPVKTSLTRDPPLPLLRVARSVPGVWSIAPLAQGSFVIWSNEKSGRARA
jgi:hypothetical protein